MTTSPLIRVDEIVAELRRLGNPDNVAGMARYGIADKEALGISAGQLRALAGQLCATDIFEARLLAAFVAEPKRLTRRQPARGPRILKTGPTATVFAFTFSAKRRLLTRLPWNAAGGSPSSSSGRVSR